MKRLFLGLASALFFSIQACTSPFAGVKSYPQPFGGGKSEYRIPKPVLLYDFVRRQGTKAPKNKKYLIRDNEGCTTYDARFYADRSELKIRLNDCNTTSKLDELFIFSTDGLERYVFQEAFDNANNLVLIAATCSGFGQTVDYSSADKKGEKYLSWLGRRGQNLIEKIEDAEANVIATRNLK